MPSKKVTTQPEKVMDVASPGKGRIMATSRPVITPVVSGEGDSQQTISEIKPAASPSMTHKVIQPLTAQEQAVEAAGTEVVPSDTLAEEEPATKTQEPIKIDVKPAPGKEAVVEEQLPVKKTETESEPEPEQTDSKFSATPEASNPKEPEATQPKTDSSTQPEESGSDSAGVDELAKSVETKRDAVKKAEEAAQKQAELQKLIDSKQYFVPIGHSVAHKSSSGKSAVIILLLVLCVIAGAYLAADAGIIEAPFTLPIDLIPN